MHIATTGITDTGRIRPGNEDAFLIRDSLAIVADGMGGAAAGEVASSLAVNIIASALEGVAPESDAEAERLIRDAILDADEQIRYAAERNRSLSGMGTTVVVALRLDDRVIIGYVGDSRAYLISGGNSKPSSAKSRAKVDTGAQTIILPKIETEKAAPSAIRRLTDDHSVVMGLVQAGVITENDIRTHPFRNRITRCVGSLGNQEPDFLRFVPQKGDVLILCSDGLWEMVHEDLI
ncbi:MAG: PP2C family protein-serine/threonine phosphatase, partial [Candidatus Latescibacterota bacterium]